MVSRRHFLLGGAFLLAGCQSGSLGLSSLGDQNGWRSAYAPKRDERFPLPAIDISDIDKQYLRQRVSYKSKYRAGTIVVDTSGPFLYHTEPGGTAMRYGIGVGRQGFTWAGTANIGAKRTWPTWTPPPAMIRREPHLRKYAGGMDPGLNNPLGARALNLNRGGRDTLYRIHGTNEPWSIGKRVSSGCIRMFNQDVIHLHDNVRSGTRVVVLRHA